MKYFGIGCAILFIIGLSMCTAHHNLGPSEGFGGSLIALLGFVIIIASSIAIFIFIGSFIDELAGSKKLNNLRAKENELSGKIRKLDIEIHRLEHF